MSLSTGKRLAVLVTTAFVVVIAAWIWLVRFAAAHGDKPIPLPPPPARSP